MLFDCGDVTELHWFELASWWNVFLIRHQQWRRKYQITWAPCKPYGWLASWTVPCLLTRAKDWRVTEKNRNGMKKVMGRMYKVCDNKASGTGPSNSDKKQGLVMLIRSIYRINLWPRKYFRKPLLSVWKLPQYANVFIPADIQEFPMTRLHSIRTWTKRWVR